MKLKSAICCVVAAMLLVSCATEKLPESSAAPTGSDPEMPPSASPDAEPTEDVRMPELLDQAVPTGVNTWYIPNEAVESLEVPELLEFRGDILTLGVSLGTGSGTTMHMKLISAADGSLLGEVSMESSGFSHVQTNGDLIGVCDAGRGTVLVLNEKLEIEAAYQYPPGGEFWCLSKDFETLYTLSWIDGITSVKLDTGELVPIFSNVAEFHVRNNTEDYVAFCCIDMMTQKNICAILDLETGEIVPVPTAGSWISVCQLDEEAWMLGGVPYIDEYVIVQGGRESVLYKEDSLFEVLLTQGHLLETNLNERNVSLYTLSGAHVSTSDLPEGEGRYVGRSFLWSEVYGGYFFVDYEMSRYGTLGFWEVDVPTEGEPLPISPADTDIPGGVSADAELYQRAREMSERFDVDIRIADQCRLEYPSFQAFAVSDCGFITEGLDTLEQALTAYPAGFFEQLQYGTGQEIRFELVGGLSARDEELFGDSTQAYAAYAQQEKDGYVVVVDVYMISETAVYHEIAHIIDGRLAWDAKLRSDALFSEEYWLSLQPEGFSYANTYGQMPAEVLSYVNSGYFVNEYACRYPTEDRATMMERAMTDSVYVFENNPHLYEKLRYYSRCIRDCFNTDGWPDVLPWERLLQGHSG